jgi:hypothetical protein
VDVPVETMCDVAGMEEFHSVEIVCLPEVRVFSCHVENVNNLDDARLAKYCDFPFAWIDVVQMSGQAPES